MSICGRPYADTCFITGICPCGRDVMWVGVPVLGDAISQSFTVQLTGVQSLRNALIALGETIRPPSPPA
jgi:hypothetical protein